MRSVSLRYQFRVCLIAALLLNGCKLLEEEPAEDTFSAAVAAGAPAIWGDPDAVAVVGTPYRFAPETSDEDGDILSFSIANKPSWTDFDEGSGQLSGMPTMQDVGIDDEIIISVTDGNSIISLPPFSITVSITSTSTSGSSGDGTSSQPPSISGTPNTTAVVDNTYSFQPNASDPDNDPLSFSIVNKPGWATFSTTTGLLQGQPGTVDIGESQPIEVSVNDGQSVAALNQFTISVQAAGVASITLNWTAPTENEDGSPLTDLAGYRVYYGTASGSYGESVQLNSAGITSTVIDNLSPGRYFLVMTSFNSSNMESRYSTEISFQLGS